MYAVVGLRCIKTKQPQGQTDHVLWQETVAFFHTSECTHGPYGTQRNS